MQLALRCHSGKSYFLLQCFAHTRVGFNGHGTKQSRAPLARNACAMLVALSKCHCASSAKVFEDSEPGVIHPSSTALRRPVLVASSCKRQAFEGDRGGFSWTGLPLSATPALKYSKRMFMMFPDHMWCWVKLDFIA